MGSEETRQKDGSHLALAETVTHCQPTRTSDEEKVTLFP